MSRHRTQRSRKRRNPGGPPRAVASPRRDVRAARTQQARHDERPGGRVGERPEGPFGGVPVSEVAILAGLVAFVVGFLSHADPPLIVGIVVCALGVIEITAREHFSGYRSHTALLAFVPAVAVIAAVALAVGEPRQRGLLVLVALPVFGLTFWLLRRRFLAARQARIARAHVPR